VSGLGEGVIAPKGWYDDLPLGERIVKAPVAALGIVAYVSTGLPRDPCEAGQPATIYVRQFGNGESRVQGGSGEFVESVYMPEGIAGLDMIAVYDAGCSVDCFPEPRVGGQGSTASSTLKFANVKLPDILGQHRISWRQLAQ
jgi:hypothetical protein